MSRGRRRGCRAGGYDPAAAGPCGARARRLVAVVGDEQDGRRRLVEGGPQVGDQVGTGGGVQPVNGSSSSSTRGLRRRGPGRRPRAGPRRRTACGRAGRRGARSRARRARAGRAGGPGPGASPAAAGRRRRCRARRPVAGRGAAARPRPRCAAEPARPARRRGAPRHARLRGSRWASARSSVDFPAPFGPSTASVSPSATSRRSHREQLTATVRDLQVPGSRCSRRRSRCRVAGRG